MAIVKAKPTSPGRRGVVQVKHPHLHKGAPHAPLLEKKSKTGGRNNAGRITTRHRGGGHKQHYRVIDFKRDKDGIVGRVERIEYDPNRTAHIALVIAADFDSLEFRSLFICGLILYLITSLATLTMRYMVANRVPAP